MNKRHVFWIAAAIATGLWLLGTWGVPVQATHPVGAREESAPLANKRAVCNQGPDLQITGIRLDPLQPGVGQSYNVHVQITNDGTTTNRDSWAHLFIDRAPSNEPDIQAFAATAGLGQGQSIEAHFTITEAYSSAGWHTLSVRIDAPPGEIAEACGGEGNNDGAITFEIQQVYPTATPAPSSTPFPPPEIFIFTPDSATVAYGDSVVLQWQVSGQAVTVYLDGELMPMVHTYTVYPTEDHVYTLRAENPGGSAQKTSRITMVEPTETPTATPTPCKYPVIHEFGAHPTSVVRGERVTIFWDVSNARQVYLNGGGVEGVSAKSFRLDQTTEFVLLARNECGEVEDTLIVQARYATPTFTLTPSRTPTPSRTLTPTYTPFVPTATPTRNMLPTFTPPPGSTATPTETATQPAFESPVGPGTPTRTPPPTPTSTETPEVTVTGTVTETATTVPTSTEEASPTVLPTDTATLVPTSTPSVTPTETAVVVPTHTIAAAVATPVPTETWTPAPTPSAALSSTTGSVRAYLCPLSVLLVFAIGVLVLSIVMPRIQERRQGVESLQHAVSVYGIASPNEQEGMPGAAGTPPLSPDSGDARSEGAT